MQVVPKPQQRPDAQHTLPPEQQVVPQARASRQQVPLMQVEPDGQGHTSLQAGKGGQEREEHLYVVFGQ